MPFFLSHLFFFWFCSPNNKYVYICGQLNKQIQLETEVREFNNCFTCMVWLQGVISCLLSVWQVNCYTSLDITYEFTINTERAGKYEYSVTTANFSVREKCQLSIAFSFDSTGLSCLIVLNRERCLLPTIHDYYIMISNNPNLGL